MEHADKLVETALSVWSIRVQFGIVIILTALFFIAWAFSRRKVLASWMLAWLMDVVALAAVLVIAGTDPFGTYELTWAMYALYSIAKVMFAGLLMVGLYRFRHATWAMSSRATMILLLLAVSQGVIGLFFVDEVVQIQTTAYFFVGTILFVSGISAVIRGNGRGVRLIGLAFLVHGTLFLHHFVVLFPTYLGGVAPPYMSRISFLDAISEFLLALGCVLAIGIRVMDETVAANAKLEARERALRNLVDADPLTGLHNRRRLRDFLSGISGNGVLIFIDLDKFKSINDGWGHGAGDDCLVRVAEAMRKEFRSEDGLFRLGGDEFLVVAPGLDEIEARHRITELREWLAHPDARGIPITLSVGIAGFDGETPVEEALSRADAAMYHEKNRKKIRSDQ